MKYTGELPRLHPGEKKMSNPIETYVQGVEKSLRTHQAKKQRVNVRRLPSTLYLFSRNMSNHTPPKVAPCHTVILRTGSLAYFHNNLTRKGIVQKIIRKVCYCGLHSQHHRFVCLSPIYMPCTVHRPQCHHEQHPKTPALISSMTRFAQC